MPAHGEEGFATRDIDGRSATPNQSDVPGPTAQAPRDQRCDCSTIGSDSTLTCSAGALLLPLR